MASDAEFRARAHALIPGGAHTYSKGDDQLPSRAPAAFVRGKGARVWDLSGRELVDWGMGINNVLVGHAEDAIDAAVIEAVRGGQNFSRPTPREVEAAEAVLGLFDGFDMIKFAKDGSDVNSAAVRLARAITGRDMVAFDGSAPFLAIDDWFIGNTPVNAGVAQRTVDLTVPFRFNDVASVEAVFAEHGARLAAVILEPCREIRPSAEFLSTIRRLCDQHGTLFILDEVVTAFRYAREGAHTLFGVKPDLMSIGKGMANGYAVSALVGKREYMERGGLRHDRDRCFLLSTTNGAEQSGLAAVIATVAFYRQHDVIGAIAATGRKVLDGLKDAAGRHGIGAHLFPATDFDCRPTLRFQGSDGEVSQGFRTLFIQEMLAGGVFMPWICPSFRHTAEDLDRTFAAFDGACRTYARAIDAGGFERFLEGPPARPVMRRRN
jgi:glutamate-1-semialdehyde 2,1-aminomutase